MWDLYPALFFSFFRFVSFDSRKTYNPQTTLLYLLNFVFLLQTILESHHPEKKNFRCKNTFSVLTLVQRNTHCLLPVYFQYSSFGISFSIFSIRQLKIHKAPDQITLCFYLEPHCLLRCTVATTLLNGIIAHICFQGEHITERKYSFIAPFILIEMFSTLNYKCQQKLASMSHRKSHSNWAFLRSSTPKNCS